MLIFFIMSIFLLALLIIYLFFFVSKKSNFDKLFNSSFECGFTSYFFSRFSFSMHYFLISLIFLFLDLELCYLFPFFNEDFSSFTLLMYIWIFISLMILTLMEEWSKGLLDWKF